MYSYKPLEAKIQNLGLTKSSLTAKLGISSRAIAKMSKGEKIADHVLKKYLFFLGAVLLSFILKSAITLFFKFAERRKSARFLVAFTTSCRFA